MKANVLILILGIFFMLNCTEEEVISPNSGSVKIEMGSSSLLKSFNAQANKNSVFPENSRVRIVPKSVTGYMEQQMAFVGEGNYNTFWYIGGNRHSCELAQELIHFDFSSMNTFIEESADTLRNEAKLGYFDTIKMQFVYLDFVFAFHSSEYSMRVYLNQYDGFEAGDIIIDGSKTSKSIALEILWEWYQSNTPQGCNKHILDYTLDANQPFKMDKREADVLVTVDLDFSQVLTFSQYPVIDYEGHVDTSAPPLFDIDNISNLTIYDILPGLMYPFIKFDASVRFLD